MRLRMRLENSEIVDESNQNAIANIPVNNIENIGMNERNKETYTQQ